MYVMPAGAKIYSSTNATTWVERTNPESSSSGFYVSVFVDGNFWLLPDSSTSTVALRSSNGIDWTAVTGLTALQVLSLAQNGSDFVGGNYGVVTQSVKLNLAGSAIAATFSVSAYLSGGTLTYQWQVSTDAGTTWSSVSGATSATLSLSGLTTADNGKRYRCIVSATGVASVTTNSATLTVT
jgi:hypothetical protein